MQWPGNKRWAAVVGGSAVLSVGIILLAPRSGAGSTRSLKSRASTASTTTLATLPPSTTVPVTDTTAPPTTEAAPARDPDVLGLQQRLADLGYDIGTPDGVFGDRTWHTVMAFQKVEGLSRTGEDSAALRAALAKASPPGPVVPSGASTRVEVDINRQVLLLWQGGKLARILSVSTGSGARYCVDGECDVAVTPTGTFQIGRKYSGLEVSRLGVLYSPSYFYGGIAIHGSPSVPGYPASHGCVRVPLYSATSLFDQLPSGMPVYVVGPGPSAHSVPPPPDKPTHPASPPPVDPGDVPATTSTTRPVATTLPPTTTSTTLPGGSSTVPRP